ncbi:MAG: 5-oxoprolinase subunit PxpB [bacterium]|nr:5-oxoprolinase subunit PxpB [bacterium]
MQNAQTEVCVEEGMPWRRVLAVGDAALLFEFGESVEVEINDRVHRAARAARQLIERGRLTGVWGVIPSYATLLLEFDPLTIGREELVARLERQIRESADQFPGVRRFRVPVWYAGEDLAEVAGRTGLSAEEVVALHTSADYRIFTVGFTPGQPLCGILPEPLRLPRRGSPRASVPVGSVAIAGRQATIYPTPSPGGWHLLGRTPAVPFRPDRMPPVLWSPGDLVRFYAVDRSRYEELLAASNTGDEWLSGEPAAEGTGA